MIAAPLYLWFAGVPLYLWTILGVLAAIPVYYYGAVRTYYWLKSKDWAKDALGDQTSEPAWGAWLVLFWFAFVPLAFLFGRVHWAAVRHSKKIPKARVLK